MQTSSTKLIKNLEQNVDDENFNQELNSSKDINQLTTCLKHAIFSKYISEYLIEIVEQMWIVYEKRINKFLEEKNLQITCNYVRPQTVIKLEELVKYQENSIEKHKKDLEILCSSQKRLQNESKFSIGVQSSKYPLTSTSTIRVPKTPKCLNRSHITNDFYNDDVDDTKRSKIVNQEFNALSLSSSHHNRRHCIFQHGEILPVDQSTKTRTIRITYLCNN